MNDPDVLREFLTSVKQIRHRDGRMDAFDRTKIERSVAVLARAYGLDSFQTMTLATDVANAVLTHLRHTHDGHSIPTTDEIRTVVATALIRLNVAPIAELYRSSVQSPDATPMNSSPMEPRMKPSAVEIQARRRRLPDERRSVTHKFEIGPHQGYITVGLYDDGTPGEIFLTMSKEGSILSGLVDAFATSISIGLQYGVPLKVVVAKFSHMRFEPAGETQNPNIPVATSIVDYVFRWLALKFLTPEDRQALGIHGDIGTSDVARDNFTFNRERQQSISFDHP